MARVSYSSVAHQTTRAPETEAWPHCPPPRPPDRTGVYQAELNKCASWKQPFQAKGTQAGELADEVFALFPPAESLSGCCHTTACHRNCSHKPLLHSRECEVGRQRDCPQLSRGVGRLGQPGPTGALTPMGHTQAPRVVHTLRECVRLPWVGWATSSRCVLSQLSSGKLA